jgi:hypothetical protein
MTATAAQDTTNTVIVDIATETTAETGIGIGTGTGTGIVMKGGGDVMTGVNHLVTDIIVVRGNWTKIRGGLSTTTMTDVATFVCATRSRIFAVAGGPRAKRAIRLLVVSVVVGDRVEMD